jgi:hypothetical protein
VVRGRRILLVVAALVLCAWCGWVSGFHRSTTASEATWVLSLVAVVAVHVALRQGRRGARLGWHLDPAPEPWPRRGRGGSGRALRGVAPWLVLIVVAVAWDVLGIDTGPQAAHLTISALAQAYRPLNAFLLLIWILLGVGYQVARVRAPLGVAPTRDAGEPREGVAWCAAGVAPVAGHPFAPGLLLPSNKPAGVAFWVAVVVAAFVVDAFARRSAGRLATAEEFVRFISTATLANFALIIGWAFAGYHLFAR